MKSTEPPATEGRKAEHVQLAATGEVGHRGKRTGFSEIEFEHNALPELAKHEIETDSTLLGHSLRAPIVISSMTGGYAGALEINHALAELAELSGISEPDLRELVDYGAITPRNPDSPQWTFKGECLVTVRAACRLRVNFDLEPHGVALVVSLLERIHDLEAQLIRLSAQMPHGPR